MTSLFDEFSKSLDESVPRRESLRRFGAMLAGAVLSPLGFGITAAAGPDPCKAFCKCRNKTQQSQCLAACKACSGQTSRICGGCGNYVCCGAGEGCCGGYCTNLADDFYHCGECWNACSDPGPLGSGACVDGECEYLCQDGAVACGGWCTFLDEDPDNCGACGNVCGGSTPYCTLGACVAPNCGPNTDFNWDNSNCGWCGNICPQQFTCVYGVCEGY